MKIIATTTVLALVGAAAVTYKCMANDSSTGSVATFELEIAKNKSVRRLATKQISFYAMGDSPYSLTEKDNLPLQLAKLDTSAEFIVHLGDMQDRTPQCKPAPYKELATVLKKSEVPMFIIPGDNCWYDCANRAQGFEYWKDSFHGFDTNWETPFNVRYQPTRKENFAFTMHRVLFVGVHTLWSRNVKDQGEWRQIENDNINWTRNQFIGFAHSGKVDAVVILSHSYPRKELYKKFNEFLSDEATDLGIPFLLLQGDAHRFRQDTPFDAKNILRTIVDRGGLADPTKITIDLSKNNPFIFERRELTGM